MESVPIKEVNSREKLNRKTKSKRRKREESEEVGQTQSTWQDRRNKFKYINIHNEYKWINVYR